MKAGLVAKEEDLRNNALNSFMYPLTAQPQALRGVNDQTMNEWLGKFDVAPERRIAKRTKALLDQALQLRPGDRELQRLAAIATATEHLVNFFRCHHSAMVYANAAGNTPAGKIRDERIAIAATYLQQAVETIIDYKNVYRSVLENEGNRRLSHDMKALYINTLVAAVREACHLFDRDFPGLSALNYFDGKLC